MQLLRIQSSGKTGLAVAGLLWLGLAAAIATMAMTASRSHLALSLVIALLTLFVAAIVATFSLRYMRSDNRSARYFLRLAALVVSVLAFLFTGNLLVLGAAWCASGLLLAALIGHSAGWSEANAAAGRARAAFLAGDAALLAALGILGWNSGSLQIDTVIAGASALPVLLSAAVGLLLVVAAAARCALPPFSGWLLCSMTAPTPVSALMHAGLVNAGGFLLIRFAPVLEAAPGARALAIALGLCGAVYGIGIMMVRPDVKRSLAGSTVSQMGFMIMSCGLGAYAAALWHIIAHGLFKAWLFLGSGSAIGMKVGKAETPLSGRTTLAIAAVTVGLGLPVLTFSAAGAGLVPLLLGLATAIATLVALIGSKAPVRTKLVLVLGLALLIAFHGAGLGFADWAIGGDAEPLVPNGVLLALLVAFLGAWTWQQQRICTGRGLPLRLYVCLINAGALVTTRNGELK